MTTRDPQHPVGAPAAPTERVQELAAGVRQGNRRALARSITLVESRRADHRTEAASLVDLLLPEAGNAIRIGISGPPGAGKSTFIEAFGVRLVDEGHRVAVLAIDPSSTRSGGSILGDKTRMELLAQRPEAYIRPSPSGGSLGGVARRTREAMVLCEAAGFDVVLVETVGVGQSETEVDDLVDIFVLLASPGAGDELQGIKRGVMELADLVVVNKADGDLLGPARTSAADHRHALHLMRPKHEGISAEVVLCSALTGMGIDDVWDAVQRLHDALRTSGQLAARRGDQAVRALWTEVRERLLQALAQRSGAEDRIAALETAVRSGATGPGLAAEELFALLHH